MSILSILSADNFITVNRTVAKIVGLEAAVIFGELASESLYWSERNPDSDGYFYSTIENLEEKTLLSAYSQRVALQRLQTEGWIDVVKKGLPAKRYIKIFEDKVMEAVNDKSLKILTTVHQKTLQQDVEIFNAKKNITKKNIEKEKDSIRAVINNSGYSSTLQTALQDFNDMRNKLKKPMTARALSMLVKKAGELAGGNEDIMAEIFNQSTQNSWLGVYPLKTSYQSGGRSGRNEFLEMLDGMEEEGHDQKGGCSDLGFTSCGISEHAD